MWLQTYNAANNLGVGKGITRESVGTVSQRVESKYLLTLAWIQWTNAVIPNLSSVEELYT